MCPRMNVLGPLVPYMNCSRNMMSLYSEVGKVTLVSVIALKRYVKALMPKRFDLKSLH